MADLITVQDVEERIGHTLQGALNTQAARRIADASALVRQAAQGLLDAVNPPDVPPVIVTVTVAAVQRALANALARSSEAIDGHQWSAADQTGVFLSKDEKRTIRREVGVLGVNSVILEGDLPIQSTFGFEDELGPLLGV